MAKCQKVWHSLRPRFPRADGKMHFALSNVADCTVFVLQKKRVCAFSLMEGERLHRNVILDAGETEILWVCETLTKRKTKSDAPSSELKCDLRASKAHCSAGIFSSLQILSTLKFHLLLHFTACSCLFPDFLLPLFPCF